jgi:hypothetical protein
MEQTHMERLRNVIKFGNYVYMFVKVQQPDAKAPAPPFRVVVKPLSLVDQTLTVELLHDMDPIGKGHWPQEAPKLKLVARTQVKFVCNEKKAMSASYKTENGAVEFHMPLELMLSGAAGLNLQDLAKAKVLY